MIKRNICLFCFIILFFQIRMGYLSAMPERVLIENPKPTHIEKSGLYVPLKEVKVLHEEIDEENFLAKPWGIYPDDKKGFFVFDLILKKVFKFDKDFKLIKVFLKFGQGPSEIQKNREGLTKCYFAANNKFYVQAIHNKKIVEFDREGNHIKDYPLRNLRVSRQFVPVVDEEGNFYAPSTENEGIDVFDEKLKFKYTLLQKKDLNRRLFHLPKFDDPRVAVMTEKFANMEAIYDVLSDGRLVVFIPGSATIYIFRDGKQLKQFHVWPKEALKTLKSHVDKMKKEGEGFSANLFSHFYVDKDDDHFFYLS